MGYIYMSFDLALGNGKEVIRTIISKNKSSHSVSTCSTNLKDSTR